MITSSYVKAHDKLHWLLWLLLQIYAPNTVSENVAFVDDVNDNFQRVALTKPVIVW